MDSPRDDDAHKDIMVDKVNVSHNEDALREADRQISPMECLRQNPKIALWTLYANSKGVRPMIVCELSTLTFSYSRFNSCWL